MKLASFHSWADRQLAGESDLPHWARYPWPFREFWDGDVDYAGHAWGCGLR